MVTIDTCCSGMKELTETGVLAPFTAFGYETGQMNVIKSDGTTRNYDQIKYCMFCGREIKLRK